MLPVATGYVEQAVGKASLARSLPPSAGVPPSPRPACGAPPVLKLPSCAPYTLRLAPDAPPASSHSGEMSLRLALGGSSVDVHALPARRRADVRGHACAWFRPCLSNQGSTSLG